jgi:hypothetical protein
VTSAALDHDGRLGAQNALISLSAARNPGQPGLTWEPVSGIEPLTCRLQEPGLTAPGALPALTLQNATQNALNALAITAAPFHEPFHGRFGGSVTLRARGGQGLRPAALLRRPRCGFRPRQAFSRGAAPRGAQRQARLATTTGVADFAQTDGQPDAARRAEPAPRWRSASRPSGHVDVRASALRCPADRCCISGTTVSDSPLAVRRVSKRGPLGAP